MSFLNRLGHIDLAAGSVCQRSWPLVSPTFQNGTLFGTFVETPPQFINFNEDQSVNTSSGSVMHIQTGFQQRLSISLLDEPSLQGTMPSKRCIVETVHWGNELNK